MNIDKEIILKTEVQEEDPTPYYFKDDEMESRVPYYDEDKKDHDWSINTGDGHE